MARLARKSERATQGIYYLGLCTVDVLRHRGVVAAACRTVWRRRSGVAHAGASSPTSSLDLWYPLEVDLDQAVPQHRAGGSSGSGSGQGSACNASSSSSSANSAAASVVAAAGGGLAQRRPGHGGRDASLLSVEEQERELALVSSGAGLPRAEARLEQLALWVGAAAAFGAAVWRFGGAEKGQEWFAGYLLEQSLSVDNLFVFVLVFGYFKTPPRLQAKVLNYGIATAAVLRLVMILLGTELVARFEPAMAVFAAVLLWSAWGLLFGEDEGVEDLADNKASRGTRILQVCRGLLPVSDHYDGDRFLTTAPAGAGGGSGGGGAAQAARTVATPLLLALAVIELSDVVFAVDSIPAVFGVTRDPFIVYTSNLFAILSLRSLYGFVSTVLTEMRFLDKSVAVVLAFIGAKMLAEFGGVHVPTDASLAVVGTMLGGGVAASLLLPERGGDGGGGSGGNAK